MMSSGQRVDTPGGSAQPQYFQFHVTHPLHREQKKWYSGCLANVLASTPQLDVTRKSFEIVRWALPPHCVYLTSPHVTRSPSLSPSYLHTAKDKKRVQEVGLQLGIALLECLQRLTLWWKQRLSSSPQKKKKKNGYVLIANCWVLII